MNFMKTIIDINNLSKTYDSGFEALKNVNLQIAEGEIFALLGPNGAGKTTLISIICGVVSKTSGTVTIDGMDNVDEYRNTRELIGLVPQEIFVDIFLTVEETFKIARGFFGKKHDQALIDKTLKDLSLWDKKDTQVQDLSGGMKRRVLIGKALMNEPRILFLDEPTAGVDVELRKGMWDLVWKLKEGGTTVILTTHYIEEAEEMADRVGVIANGELKMVEKKDTLMQKLGHKSLTVALCEPLAKIPDSLADYDLSLSTDNIALTYTYKAGEQTGITKLLSDLKKENIVITDVETEKTSLEEIFVDLVKK